MKRDSITLDVGNCPQERRDLYAAIAMNALCEIANYEDPENLKDDEQLSVLRGDEMIEMAYENVLETARSAIDEILATMEKLDAGDD